jgi:hypothetical protein
MSLRAEAIPLLLGLFELPIREKSETSGLKLQ